VIEAIETELVAGPGRRAAGSGRPAVPGQSGQLPPDPSQRRGAGRVRRRPVRRSERLGWRGPDPAPRIPACRQNPIPAHPRPAPTPCCRPSGWPCPTRTSRAPGSIRPGNGFEDVSNGVWTYTAVYAADVPWGVPGHVCPDDVAMAWPPPRSACAIRTARSLLRRGNPWRSDTVIRGRCRP